AACAAARLKRKRERLMKLIKDLWRGDVPLVSTYWGYGVGVGLGIQVSFFVIAIAALHHAAAFAAAVIGVVVVGLGHHVFMLGAIWRSASKYTGRPIWRILAKTAVVLGVLSIPGALADLAKTNTVNDETLRRQSEIVNRDLPRMIDDATRFDSMTVGQRELVYHYTIVTKKASDIEPTAFLHAMRNNMQRQLCGTRYVQSVMRNQFSVSYSFDGMDQQSIGKVALVAADCPTPDAK